VIPVLRQQFPALRSHFDPRWGETAGDRSALIDSVRAFVTVTSELYPELEDYYRTRVDEVLATLGYLRGFCRPIQHTIGTEHPRFGGTPAHDDAIERLMRAWARSQEPVTCLAAGMARNSRRKALEKYLHEYALLHGKLPAGEVRPIEHLDSWTIDIDDLTETGELVERLLTEGRAPVDTDPAWLAGAADHLSILEFGQRYYVVHEDELEGPFVVADLEDYLRELVYDNGELIARLSWDGGAPGSSGCVSAYRLFGKLFITNEMGLNGPFDDFCDAARRFGLYWINDATTEIWDAEHGTVFENGVLYRPDVVERYGKISIDMEYEAGHGPTEEASAS
jgi:hypothetical protein